MLAAEAAIEAAAKARPEVGPEVASRWAEIATAIPVVVTLPRQEVPSGGAAARAAVTGVEVLVHVLWSLSVLATSLSRGITIYRDTEDVKTRFPRRCATGVASGDGLRLA